MKYILVTGGVISGVGKGVIASSFGSILKHCGIHVTSIKIDPYINIDAGTFSPYEHGEVYVLDDGGEVDLDLGNYERFLDVTLHKDNNITTGKIYLSVIEKERHGDYLGKTVQVVPHVTDAIQDWVERVANQPVTEDGEQPQVCIVELGGTIGDIEGMPFVEAFRQFQFRAKKDNFCCAHVSHIPQPKATGESKTKPTQQSVVQLRALGLSPDLIICRSEEPVGDSIKEKISNFCHVATQQVITIHDLPSIYQVPLLMEEQNIVGFLNDRLQLNINMKKCGKPEFMIKWRNLAERIEFLREEVKIVLVGKYTKLEDSYASVKKALQHAAIKVGYKLNLSYIEAENLEKKMEHQNPAMYYEAWQRLCKADGVIVPGGFGERGVEGKVAACQWCRQNNKPFLGICLGLQTAVIEFARNVLDKPTANSTEVDANTADPVIIEMPEHNSGKMGGTMRLGKRYTRFTTGNSIMKQLYNNVDRVEERHRHRYEVNPKYINDLEAAGMKFVGHDDEQTRMEIMELEGKDYYVATQFHPEYLSRPLKPSPPFMGLILASVKKLNLYLANQMKFSAPYASASETDSDEDSSKSPKKSTNEKTKN